MGAARYAIIIPFHNGLNTIQELVHRIEKVFSGLSHEYRVVIVDDSGNTEKHELLSYLFGSIPYIELINLERNYGQHYATFVGLETAVGWHAITLDEDLQHLPEEIPRFILEHERTGKCVVYGKRQQQFLKHWISKFILLFFSGRPETTCSYRLIDAELSEDITRAKPVFYQTEGSIIKMRPKFGYVPIAVKESKRTSKNSGYTWLGLIWMITNLIAFYSRFPLILICWSILIIQFPIFFFGNRMFLLYLAPISWVAALVLVGYIFVWIKSPTAK